MATLKLWRNTGCRWGILVALLLAGPLLAASTAGQSDGQPPVASAVAFAPGTISLGMPATLDIAWMGDGALWHVAGQLSAVDGGSGVTFGCNYEPADRQGRVQCTFDLPPAARGRDFRLQWLWLEDTHGRTTLMERGTSLPDDGASVLRHHRPGAETGTGDERVELWLVRSDPRQVKPGDEVAVRLVASASQPLTRVNITLQGPDAWHATTACPLPALSYVDEECLVYIPPDAPEGQHALAAFEFQYGDGSMQSLQLDTDYRSGLDHEVFLSVHHGAHLEAEPQPWSAANGTSRVVNDGGEDENHTGQAALPGRVPDGEPVGGAADDSRPAASTWLRDPRPWVAASALVLGLAAWFIWRGARTGKPPSDSM